MRTIYLILTVLICVSIILFVATFFYIDTHRHNSLYYNSYDGQDITAVTSVDIYNTEDQIVYKSVSDTPFSSTVDKQKRKLSVDKKNKSVTAYNKKYLSEGVSLDVYIRRMDSAITFLAVGYSDFAYADRLPVEKDFAVFEEDAVISYFNLIDKYDFKARGAQSVPVLTHTYTFLPPYRNEVQIRLADEETVDLGSEKTKALKFRLTTHDKKEILLWINKWSRIPVLVKIPQTGFRAVLTDGPKKINAKIYKIEDKPSYKDKDVAFKNKDVTLAGTLSLPEKEGPLPAIILVWGPGPQDRDGLGMFVDLADSLAKKGVAVLRFDKRGVGKSEGNFSRFTTEDLIGDIAASVEFLAQQKEIDKKRIAILGHSEGGYCAASVAAANPNIAGLIIMSGIEAVNLPDTDLERMWSFDQAALEWDEDYINDITKTANDTSEMLNSKSDWAVLMHKRVFLKKSCLDIARKPMEVIRKIKAPVLLLYGKKDTVILPEHIRLLEEALKEGGNKDYEITAFSKLNHFLGQKIEDHIHRAYVSLDKEVIDVVTAFIEKRLPAPPPPEAASAPAQTDTALTQMPAAPVPEVAPESGTKESRL